MLVNYSVHLACFFFVFIYVANEIIFFFFLDNSKQMAKKNKTFKYDCHDLKIAYLYTLMYLYGRTSKQKYENISSATL